MKHDAIKVSILLVTHNHESYISECLHGIGIQEIPFPYEVVMADDLSGDGTVDLARTYFEERKIPYRILPTEHHLGMARNYERGFAACTGQYVATLEGDDYWTHSRNLVRHVSFLDRHHECVMSFSRPVFLDQSTRRFTVDERDSGKTCEYLTTADLARGNKIGNLSTCVFRSRAVSMLDEEFWSFGAADWGFGLALGRYGLIAKLRGPMSVYRVHDNGLWSRKSKAQQKQWLDAQIRIWNRYLGYVFEKEFTELREKRAEKTVLARIKRAIRRRLRRPAGATERR